MVSIWPGRAQKRIKTQSIYFEGLKRLLSDESGETKFQVFALRLFLISFYFYILYLNKWCLAT